MSYPNFYDSQDVERIYNPRLQEAHEAGVSLRSALTSSHSDNSSKRVLLWLIDMQVDFILPEGHLTVPGAVEDARRTIEFIYRNIGKITTIAASLDTHFPYQIFHRLWWLDENGNHPDPMTMVTSADISAGKYRPVTKVKWSIEYVAKLEQAAKKVLMIWPDHCFEGSVGRALLPALTEAISVHSVARYSQPEYLVKGDILETENYSVLEPEVKVPGHPKGSLNTDFLNFVGDYDEIYVAGQAKSHCVLETMKSFFAHFGNDPKIIEKLHFLEDCTSSIPGFEAETDQAFSDFANQGMKIVTSSNDIA